MGYNQWRSINVMLWILWLTIHGRTSQFNRDFICYFYIQRYITSYNKHFICTLKKHALYFKNILNIFLYVSSLFAFNQLPDITNKCDVSTDFEQHGVRSSILSNFKYIQPFSAFVVLKNDGRV